MASPSSRRDLKALHRLITQADLVLNSIPNPHPSIASARESLNAALALSCDLGGRTETPLQPKYGALSAPVRDLSKVRTNLRRALTRKTAAECHGIIRESLDPLDRIAKLIASPATLMGRLGGKKTAERGPEYFAKIAAMRKTRAGGRPKREGSPLG